MFKNILSKIFNRNINVVKPNDNYVFVLRKNTYGSRKLISFDVFYKDEKMDVLFFHLTKDRSITRGYYSPHWFKTTNTKLPTSYSTNIRKEQIIDNNDILNTFYNEGIIL